MKNNTHEPNKQPAHHGVILSFNSSSGHGIGEAEVEGEKVKVHIRNIDLSGHKGHVPINKGQAIRCDVADNGFGREAVNVRLV